MSNGIACMWMRGGTSKGGYFLASDLPSSIDERDALLLQIIGSPDSRQIDGMGGGDPLTSKVAIVKKSNRNGVDVDYLFLQVSVDEALVSDGQNCGNILAGVGPFAIERGLINATGENTDVAIFMENTGQIAVATVETSNGKVNYLGSAKIDGVPGSAAPIPLLFKDTAGSTCGELLPTGNVIDEVNGINVTMIDNGMPVVILKSDDLGIEGTETRNELDVHEGLKATLEAIRLKCGPMMNLGNVSDKTIPKMTIVSSPKCGGTISTRTFIPHRCHASIGVLGAVSVATACLMEGSAASSLAVTSPHNSNLSIEHPSGETTVIATVENSEIKNAAILRTAKKLMDGTVFP